MARLQDIVQFEPDPIQSTKFAANAVMAALWF
jgi:hypothetical protein